MLNANLTTRISLQVLFPRDMLFLQFLVLAGSDLLPGPGAGVYPTRGGSGAGGMLVGPNDPRFVGGVGGDPLLPGGLPGVLSGAWFDPYGPPDVPGFEPGGFIRGPRRPGDGGRPHPDLPHFGGDSDYI